MRVVYSSVTIIQVFLVTKGTWAAKLCTNNKIIWTGGASWCWLIKKKRKSPNVTGPAGLPFCCPTDSVKSTEGNNNSKRQLRPTTNWWRQTSLNVNPHTSDLNMMLLTLHPGTDGRYQSIAGMHGWLSINICHPRPSYSKPAGCRCCFYETDRQTDGRTDR